MGDFDELQGHDPQAEDELAAKPEKAEAKPEPPKDPPKPSGSSGDKK